MANQVVTTNTNFDSLVGLLIGEQTTINSGATVTINSDPQLNRVVPGNFVINEGTLLIDGTTVREISFSGASTLPVIGDTLTAGSVTGQVIGVLGTTTSGSARLRSLNGSIANGTALSFTGGKTATASSSDRVGWLQVLGLESRNISSTRQGTLSIQGLWYELGVSNGATGQTFQHYCADYVPAIWVETGAGTDVYEIWLNANPTIANVATDSIRGRMFSGSGQTISLGNGTRGAVPPNGARIRVPNIHVGSAVTGSPTVAAFNANTPTARYRTNNFLGVIDIDNALFTGWQMNCVSTFGVDINNAAFVQMTIFSYILGYMSLTNIGVGIHPTSTNNTSFIEYAFNITGVKVPVSMADCYAVTLQIAIPSRNSACPILITACPDINLNRLVVYNVQDQGTSTFDYGNIIVQNCSGIIQNCVMIGQPINAFACTNLDIINTSFSDTARIAQTTNKSLAGAVLVYLSSNVKVEGISLISTGTVPRGRLCTVNVSTNIKIRNIGTFASPVNLNSFGNSLITAINSENVEIARCYAQNVLIGLLETDNSLSNSRVLNCASDYSDRVIGVPSNSYYAAVGSGNASLGASGVITSYNSVGNHFYDFFFSATTGGYGIFFSEKTAESPSASTYTTTGTPVFNSTGTLLMRTAGDQIVYTDPYYRLGHTGFANTAFSFNGTNQASHTFEYDLDKGTGFTNTYKTVSAANLSAETGISPTTGFRMRIRITCTTSNASNAIAGFYIPTTTTPTAQQTLYPLDLVTATLTLTGLIADSEVRIFRQSDSFELAGIENCLSTFSYTYVHGGTDIPVRIVIIKEGYVFIDIATTLTASSNAIPIQQRVDYSYA